MRHPNDVLSFTHEHIGDLEKPVRNLPCNGVGLVPTTAATTVWCTVEIDSLQQRSRRRDGEIEALVEHELSDSRGYINLGNGEGYLNGMYESSEPHEHRGWPCKLDLNHIIRRRWLA